MISELTEKELGFCKMLVDNNKYTNMSKLFSDLLANYKISKPRQQKISSIISQIANPAYSLEDTPEWISDNERELLGASITCTKTDAYDASYANTDCGGIKDFSVKKQFFIVAEIESVNVIKTKKGKNPGKDMCFLKISDSYGTSDCVVFPEEFDEFKNMLNPGRVLMFNGQKSAKDQTPVIKKCFVV